MKVTFIGLGIMGSRMAANLLKHNVDLTVYNRTVAASEPLVEKGAKTASSVNEAVEDADLVITMLSNPSVVEEVAYGSTGFVRDMKPGALWMDSSTVDPMFSKRMGDAASANGIRFIDAPVAGTLPHAENAQLVFYVGGETLDFELAEPLMQMMGLKAMHLGEVGSGAAFKMLVNMMLAQSMLVFSEAVLLGKKMGISEDLLFDLLPTLPVIAPFTQFKTGMMKEGSYPAMFPLELMQKDLHLASLCAYEFEQPLTMTNNAKELYLQAKQAGYGRNDFASVFEYLKQGK